MNIECPECSSNNSIEFGDNIHCCQCETSFGSYSFKKTKRLISATACVALIVGVYSANKIDDAFLDEKRYTMSEEHEMINACVDGNRRVMSKEQYNKKTKLCICAIEKTVNERKYEKLKKSELDFLAHFRKNITICQ